LSKAELIRSLFEYNVWANNAVLGAASQVAEEEITRDLGPAGAGHGSLQGILLHILGSHVSWLMKWTGEPPHIALVEPGRVMPAIRESFDAAHERLRAYVGSLTDAALDAETELMDPQDGQWRTWRRPLWQVMLSTGTHAAQHRGEAALILSGLGHSPGEIDYSMWAWRSHPS
jgi:uncharacterized damage-inducible protein DinB